MTQRWNNLILAIRKLPGVGPKMAERIALKLLKSDETAGILNIIADAKAHLKPCQLCGSFTEKNPCLRCIDVHRDAHLLCVLEEIGDLDAMERSGAYKGHYHLLGGVLSPLDGIGPAQLRIKPLLERLQNANNTFKEIILATNPTVEGEATATYLTQALQPLDVKITRLAYGLPSGTAIEYADELTLTRAFEGRTELLNV